MTALSFDVNYSSK